MPDHGFQSGIYMGGVDGYVGMPVGEDPEDLVGKPLPDPANPPEVQDDFPKPIEIGDQSFGLGT